jgi:hypothetical protein
LILEVPDMEQFRPFMESDEAKKAMQEDGLNARQLEFLVSSLHKR